MNWTRYENIRRVGEMKNT